MHWIKIVLFLIILFNAGIFGLYGTAKLIGLQGVTKIPPGDRLVHDMHPSHLMWYFFFIKRSYTILVGLAQVVPSILILFKRTRLFGSILYFCSVLNVVAINIIFGVNRGTLVLSLILFVNILIIIHSERKKLQALFN